MEYHTHTNALVDRLQQDITRRRKLVNKLKAQEVELTSRLSNRPATPDYVQDRNTYPQLPPLHVTISPTVPLHPATGLTAASSPSVALVPHQSPPRDPRQTRSDIMDLMILQNAQLSQIVMHRMALSAIQPETPTMTTHSTGTRTKINIRLDELLSLMKRKDYDCDNLCSLPPLQVLPTPTMVFYQAQPLRVPKAPRRRRRSLLVPVLERPRARKRRLPFPLTGPLKRFRRAAIAVLFSVALNHKRLRNENNPRRVLPLNENFLFGIRLRESLSAMHRIFLRPDKKIFKILQKILDDRMGDLTAVLRTDDASLDNQDVINELAIILENTIYEITEIMPKKGVLATQRKSTVYKMIQPEQIYPKGYFWEIEKELLGVDSRESLRTVSDSDASILLIGHFLGRGLIITLLLRPKEFRLIASSASLRHGSERNLRLLASLLFYLLRKIYTSLKTTKDLVDRPTEYEQMLYDDSELTEVVKNLSKSFQYGEELLTSWATEYIRRLRRIR